MIIKGTDSLLYLCSIAMLKITGDVLLSNHDWGKEWWQYAGNALQGQVAMFLRPDNSLIKVCEGPINSIVDFSFWQAQVSFRNMYLFPWTISKLKRSPSPVLSEPLSILHRFEKVALPFFPSKRACPSILHILLTPYGCRLVNAHLQSWISFICRIHFVLWCQYSVTDLRSFWNRRVLSKCLSPWNSVHTVYVVYTCILHTFW